MNKIIKVIKTILITIIMKIIYKKIVIHKLVVKNKSNYLYFKMILNLFKIMTRLI